MLINRRNVGLCKETTLQSSAETGDLLPACSYPAGTAVHSSLSGLMKGGKDVRIIEKHG
jgi:hypothetical protein